MNVLIVGCGKVGSMIAKTLASENHNIIIVDEDSDKINALTSVIDCIGVVGNGAIQSVLLSAKVDECDYLIACTESDEINILTCLIARKNSKCRTIARIRNPEYSRQVVYIMDELDISLTINPELATAHEINRILKYSSSLSSDAFFKGRMNLMKIAVPDNSSVIGCKLLDIKHKFNCELVICVIERNGDIIIPKGDTIIEKNDDLYFVADHNNVVKFFIANGLQYKTLDSCMIIGGSRIAKYLITLILNNNHSTKIKLIDIDKKVCEDFAAEFPELSVVCADATDKNMLIREGMTEVDAFIPLTGFDEENIILSLLASQNENTKIITKINHLNFIDSLKDLNMGSIVNPVKVASEIVTSYVRASNNIMNSNIETLYKLCDDRVEALGFIIKKNSSIVHIPLKDMKIKKNIIIAGIYRPGRVIIPNGMSTIEVGDRVIIISKDHILNEITDILE